MIPATTDKPTISVLIALDPFHPALPGELEGFLTQTVGPEAFELIIVDWERGPSMADRLARLRERAPAALSITYLRQSSQSRAAMNNLGIRHARAELLCFAGDDFLPCPTFVEAHLRFHEAHPEHHRAAFGAGRSPDHQRAASPFLAWLEDSGELTGTRLREPHDNHPKSFFFAANVSVKKAFLLSENGFDERLPFPSQDDADMGRRLGKRGLQSTFIDGAAATHDHLIFIAEREDQLRRGGYSQALLEAGRVPRALRGTLFAWALFKILMQMSRYALRNGFDRQGLGWKWCMSKAYIEGYWHYLRRPDDLATLNRGLLIALPGSGS